MKKIIISLLLIASFTHAWDLDKKVSKDESGIIGAHYNIPKYSYVALIGVAAYEGSDTRFGLATFKALEAGAISQAITEGIKKSTGRLRPRHSDSPTSWNEGGESFPSGHVSGMAAMVTPYILEYKDDKPMVHLLWLLPAHQMVGRVKAQAHWQSDVIVGALVGIASGYITHKMKTPLMLSFTKDNVYVGIKYRF